MDSTTLGFRIEIKLNDEKKKSRHIFFCTFEFADGDSYLLYLFSP